MKKIYLYFHNDFDGVVSCVLAFHLFKAMGFSPIIAESIIPEELENKKKKLKKPLAILDSIYKPSSFAWFDHHLMNRPKRISKKTRFWAFDGKAKCCAEIIYGFAKRKGIKLPCDKELKKLILWARIIDSALFSEHGIKAIETIKPKVVAMKIALVSSAGFRNLPRRIAKTLIKKPSLMDLARQNFIRTSYNKLIYAREKSLQAFKRHSSYDPKTGLVIYDVTPFNWVRFAFVVAYPESQISIGLVRIKKDYFIKAAKNPWNKNLSQRIKELDLGSILERVGGGGHPFVASALFPSYKKAKAALQLILPKMMKIIQ